MTQRVEGTVFRVYEKTFKGKPSVTIKIDGDPVWYRAGEKRFAGIAEPGQRIAFDAEPIEGAKDPSARVVGNVNLVTAPKTNGATGTPTTAPAQYQDRNNSIVYQSSIKAAIGMTKLLLDAGAVKLPTKQADQLGVIESLVDRYTALFFEDVGTLGAVVREQEAGGETKTETTPEDDGE